MTTLSGLVVLLDAQGGITGYRDLGQVPVQIKDGRVLPVEDIYPPLTKGEVYGPPTVEKLADKVVRTWSVVTESVQLDYGVFRLRWTDAEREALHAARKTDWRVDDFVGLAQAQGHINLTGPVAPQAKALFVALGVLTRERADAVFAT